MSYFNEYIYFLFLKLNNTIPHRKIDTIYESKENSYKRNIFSDKTKFLSIACLTKLLMKILLVSEFTPSGQLE